MPIEQLSIGPMYDLVVGVVYALPPVACYHYAQGGTIEVSNDGVTFAAPVAGAPLAAKYVRTTVAASKFVLKRV